MQASRFTDIWAKRYFEMGVSMEMNFGGGATSPNKRFQILQIRHNYLRTLGSNEPYKSK